VKNLFANGAQMTLARYPNAGFISVGSTNGTTTIDASGISRSSNYWKGANLRIRTTLFTFETRSVSSSNGTTITLASRPDYAFNVGWGFYLDNTLAELDSPGEWYCDTTSHVVYFYAPGGVDPNTLTVEGSILDYGITSSQSSITVQGLEFRCQAQAALRFSGTSSNVQILINDISDGSVNGIQLEGTSTNYTINGNTIQQVNGVAITFENAKNSTVSNNLVKNIGLVQGYGRSGVDGMNGIRLAAGSNNTISGNTVDSVGYMGIRPDGSYNLVVNNVITNAMLKLADGGAIHTYNLDGRTFSTTIRSNVIQNVVGNSEGVPQACWTDANGIYLDFGCRDMIVEANTIVCAGGNGMFMQYGTYRNILRGNVLHDCGSNPGGCFLQIRQDTTIKYGSNVITKNTFYPGNASQKMVLIQEMKQTTVIHNVGMLDSNYYCNPYNSDSPFRTVTYDGSKWTTNSQSLAGWKSVTKQDAHSSAGPQQLSGQGSGSKGSTKASSTTPNQAVLHVNATSQQKLVHLGSESFRDLDGNAVTGAISLPPYSSMILIKGSTEVETGGVIAPEEFGLYQNYPNPFNPSTTICYALPVDAKVRLEVYDLAGRRIALMVDETQRAGNHETRFDGAGLASGTYFYRIQAGVFSASRRFVLLK
jgi:parallel beta-helix repeat protein